MAVLGLSAVTSAQTARAQTGPTTDAAETTYWEQAEFSPSNAVELKIGSGYTQGFGNIAPGRAIIHVAGAGLGMSGDVDYRVNPMVSVGLEAQYQEFTTGDNTGSRGVAANVGVTAHGSPGRRGDPWIRLGTGYRLLWDVGPATAPNTNNVFHGFDAATVMLGYDFRPSEDVAFAPVVGADLQTFVWENATPLSKAQVGTFAYAGVQARFDAGASSPTTSIASGPR